MAQVGLDLSHEQPVLRLERLSFDRRLGVLERAVERAETAFGTGPDRVGLGLPGRRPDGIVGQLHGFARIPELELRGWDERRRRERRPRQWRGHR